MSVSFLSPFYRPLFSPTSSLLSFSSLPSFIVYFPPHLLCHGNANGVDYPTKSFKKYLTMKSFQSFSGSLKAFARGFDGSRGENLSSVRENVEDDSADEEEEVDEDDEEEGLENVDPIESVVPQRWDVLGLGQAMVDFSGVVDDEFLKQSGLEKGMRKVVNHEERGRILRAMDGCSYKAAAGGSLSNTMVALARLGSCPITDPPLNVAMAGSIGSDPLGGFYRSKLRRANVNFLSAPVKDGTTGTVIVLTTPDAQRTMLAYQGTSSAINYDQCLGSMVSKTNILIIEGYLFEHPDTIKTIFKACNEARRSGALVAVTASDVSCITKHYDDFWELIGKYADILFANGEEARSLCKVMRGESVSSVTKYLSRFVPLVSVTDGSNGAYMGVKGEAVYIPPPRCIQVDTCGAGDAFASGILYSMVRGVCDLRVMGALASQVAAIVVGQQGTRLSVSDAAHLAESFLFRSVSYDVFQSDVGWDHIPNF